MDRRHKSAPNQFCFICAKFMTQKKRIFSQILLIVTKASLHLLFTKKQSQLCFVLKSQAILTQYFTHSYGDCYFGTVQKAHFKRRPSYMQCKNGQLPTNKAHELAERRSRSPVIGNGTNIDSSFSGSSSAP